MFPFSLFRSKTPEQGSQGPHTLPPDITTGQMLKEIVNDALREHALELSRPARIIHSPPTSHTAIIMVDMPNWANHPENMRKAERSIETNARAVLGISASIYWRADLDELKAPRTVDAQIQRELTLLRKNARPAAIAGR